MEKQPNNDSSLTREEQIQRLMDEPPRLVSEETARVIADQYAVDVNGPYFGFVATGAITADLPNIIERDMRALAVEPRANIRKILQLGALLDYVDAKLAEGGEG